MNDLISTLLRWLARALLWAAGLLFFLSVLAAALLLALVWAVRALWARLTGRPVTPWVMRMDPRTGWSTVYRSTARWTAQRPEPPRRDDHDVTDVVPREIR